MSEAETALVAIPETMLDGAPGALAVYSEPLEQFDEGALGKLVAALAERAKEFRKTATVETRAGRDDIASFAYRLARAKTTLDAAGKAVADKIKELPKRVDANRKKVRDTIEGLQEEVRAPLDAWEATEKERTEKHLAAITRLRETGASEYPLSVSAAEIRAILEAVREMTIDEATCEEFEVDYRMERELACARLTSAVMARTQYEADQAELTRLRAEAQAREAAELKRQAEATRQERERQAELDREREAREDAERREREALAAQERAENEKRIAAERAARETAEREADELRRQEQARLRLAEAARAEAEREAEETAKRERSTKHRAAINNAAVEALRKEIEDAGFSIRSLTAEEIAKAIVVGIAKGRIPAVTVNY